MAAGVKGFISDADMAALESGVSSSKPIKKGFISDADMQTMESTLDSEDSFSPTAALEGFGEGASLGYLNNLQAATEKPVFAVLNKLTGQNVQPDDYVKARDYYNKRQEKLASESPKSFMGGQVAGVLATAAPTMGSAQAATVGGRALQAAKTGAALGALQNTAEKEGEINALDLAERAKNAGMGFATGAAGSLGADALAKGASIAKSAAQGAANKLGQKFSKTAEKLAENATGATRVQAEKYSDDAGRFLLDKGIVKAGDNAETIAVKANQVIKQTEDTIDATLKTLDQKGIEISQDQIVNNIEKKIVDLSKDPSQADVVKKLRSIADDIITTGESNISASAAEQTKRGFNKMAKNWQDPEKGAAGKIAYREYMNAVEDAAKKAGGDVFDKFKEAKQVYGKLNPIADAAEKRARQLNQNPIGGLLDVATVATGAASGEDPLSGGIAGIGAALARRNLAPRMGSTLAVAFDKASKVLLKNPANAQLAVKAPQEFVNLVYSTIKTSTDKTQERGENKWATDGAFTVSNSGLNLTPNQIDALKEDKQGKNLLIQASSMQQGSKPLMKVMEQIQSLDAYKNNVPVEPKLEQQVPKLEQKPKTQFPKTVRKDGYTAVVNDEKELREAMSEGWK